MTSRLLDAIPPYIFWELDARRSAQRALGKTLIDLGIGSPDGPIPGVVIEAMQRAATERALSNYPNFRGHPQFLRAASDYMAERFGVSIDPSSEMLALAGSKEGIAELIMSHCNPGEVVLVPEIYYPVYARATALCGAEPVFVPLLADGRLDLDSLSAETLQRARVLVVNYPSNPTTAVVPLQEFERLVDYARAHGLLLISDLAYSELSFDGFQVPSVLQVPGAKDVAVELHTCSKSFNMAGVRIAFVAGGRAALTRLDLYRANVGYGVSTVSQLAGAAAFTHHLDIVPPIVEEYRARRDAAVGALQRGGWDVVAPNATMYLWLPVPAGFDDWGWVSALMEGPGIVVTPGIAFGAAGRGRFRISLVQPPATLASAAETITSFGAVQAAV
ncbi:MAG: aminotransferase class I/II-fold pyridoxal phosphate-dependent enzyme [Gemmatimonadota bacterium]